MLRVLSIAFEGGYVEDVSGFTGTLTMWKSDTPGSVTTMATGIVFDEFGGFSPDPEQTGLVSGAEYKVRMALSCGSEYTETVILP